MARNPASIKPRRGITHEAMNPRETGTRRARTRDEARGPEAPLSITPRAHSTPVRQNPAEQPKTGALNPYAYLATNHQDAPTPDAQKARSRVPRGKESAPARWPLPTSKARTAPRHVPRSPVPQGCHDRVLNPRGHLSPRHQSHALAAQPKMAQRVTSPKIAAQHANTHRGTTPHDSIMPITSRDPASHPRGPPPRDAQQRVPERPSPSTRARQEGDETSTVLPSSPKHT